MGRERSGSTFKRGKGKKITWWARLTFIDEVTGKRKDLQRRAESKAHAEELREQLVKEYDNGGQAALESERMTFAELCDYYKAHYLVEAQYHEGRKIAGLRSLATQEGILETLREHFGNKRLRLLTYSDLRGFRAERLKTPTRGDVARHRAKLEQDPKAEFCSTRSIASVNRELALLRRMLNVAVREGWLTRNPFTAGETLISLADERKRERILTREEEARLLAACTGRRAHLKALVVAALDTGCRQGELLKLRWRDVDLEARSLVLQAFNTKTLRERGVAMTTRLYLELERLWERSSKDLDALVFGVADNVKHSFDGARKQAGLPDVRFHDLRHTAATRLVAAHISISEVGRVLGHTQVNTTYRYVNANAETARRAAAALDSFNAEVMTQEVETAADVVN
jgi:integrase